MNINQLFENLDLRVIHSIMSLYGCLAAVWTMQMYGTKLIGGSHRYLIIDTLRRASMAGIALAFLWSLNYAFDKNWQPWPPSLAMILMLNLFLTCTIVSGYLRTQDDRAAFRPTAS